MWMIFAGNGYLANDYLVYDDMLPGELAQRYTVFDPTLTLEINKIGSLTFTIYPSHPEYSHLHKLKTWISVYLNGNLYWVGRILNDPVGALNQRFVQCEEIIGALHDTVLRPFEYPGDVVSDDAATPANYLRFLVDQHNAQQTNVSNRFAVGTVTVTDPNNYISRSDTGYTDTFKLIQDGLIKKEGGYIIPRYEKDGIKIDYLAELTELSDQPILLGLNMLDIQTDRRGEDVCTAILPVGARDEESGERATIESIADGPVSGYPGAEKTGDIIYSIDAEAAYGRRIIKKMEWADVNEPENLLRKAASVLMVAVKFPSVISISAADASAATIGGSLSPWHIGQNVRLISDVHEQAHGFSGQYLIQKLKINMSHPQDTVLQLNGTALSLAETTGIQRDDAIRVAVSDAVLNQQKALRETQQLLMSEIEQTERSVSVRVADVELAVNGGVDEDGNVVSGLVSDISKATGTITELEARANGFDANISQLQEGYVQVSTHFGFGSDGLTINRTDNEVYALYSATSASYQMDIVDASGNVQRTEVFAVIGEDGVTAKEINSLGPVTGVSGEFSASISAGRFAWIDEGSLGFSLVRR